jgi:hypothetical protein
MTVDVLICPCGMRLKTPGAVPGRVGKCPRCGSRLQVPESPPAVEQPVPPILPDSGQTFTRRKGRSRSNAVLTKAAGDGFVRPPSRLEEFWWESLHYPLWNASGVGFLAFMSLGLWFATLPVFGIVAVLVSGTPFSLLGVVLLVPQLLALLAIGGYVLIFLGQVLVTSCLGELAQPRTPGWSISEICDGLGRWFWGSLVGGVVGGLPAMVYWINCGDVDWLDWIVLIDLTVPGLAYAQMALLASLIFESPLAANPFMVLGAIWRLGWAYITPCLVTSTAVIVAVGLFEAVLVVSDSFGQAAAFWAFWVVVLYSAMVVLRIFGLFCCRHASELGWSLDRPRSADRGLGS